MGEHLQRLATADVDWDQIVQIAHAHGVVPAVAESLGTHCRDEVPEAVMESLDAARQHTTKRNLQLTRDLCNLVDTFRGEGIDVMPYRGPVLSHDAYGGVEKRQFTDIDLLIDREDILEARAVLMENGYKPQYERESTDALTRGQEWAYTRFRRDYPFYNPESGTVVELHWRVIDRRFPTAIELETVWDRRESTNLAGQSIPVLSAEDRLMMLCIHGTRHHWERLEWVCDIAELLEQESICWERVLDEARSFNATRMFLLGPLIAGEMYDSDVPPEIEAAIDADSRLDELTETVYAQLFDIEKMGQIPLKRFQARALDRRRDVLRLYLQWFVTPSRSEIETLPLPIPLVFLYFLYRPLRLGSLPVIRNLEKLF